MERLHGVEAVPTPDHRAELLHTGFARARLRVLPRDGPDKRGLVIVIGRPEHRWHDPCLDFRQVGLVAKFAVADVALLTVTPEVSGPRPAGPASERDLLRLLQVPDHARSPKSEGPARP